MQSSLDADEQYSETTPPVNAVTRPLQERLRHLNTIITELTKSESLDQLARSAVEAGIRQLGFDRMGIGLFDASGEFFEGTYGTDEQGNIRDEHSNRVPLKKMGLMTAALKNHSTLEYLEDTPLYDGNGVEIAHGWNALALLWDGSRALGWVSVDNLLNQRPLIPEDVDILNLYGTSLGHLCALKRSEHDLRKERNLLRTIIDTVNDYVFVKDEQARFIMVNTASWKSSKRGLSEADMLGKTDFDLFPRDLAQKYFEEDQQIVQGGTSLINMLEPNVSVEGEPMIMLTSKVPLRDEHGQVIGLVGFSRDVTSLMKAQQQVQVNEARFKLITEMATATNIGVVMGNYLGDIAQANDAFFRITGYERSDLPHLNLTAMTPPEYATFNPQSDQRRPNGEVVALEKELVRKDKSRVPILQVGNFVGESSKDFICFIVDLTTQRQFEAERLETTLQKERSNLLIEFVSNLSHDLKTPLSIIKTSLYLLERLEDPAHHKAKIQNIRDQSLVLEKLIQSVLTMARLDGGYALSFGALDLNQVLLLLGRSMHPEAERKHQTLTLDLQTGLPAIRASESELYRVLVNLVENALAYTPEFGMITIRTLQKDGAAVVEVQDTGMGIEPQILPHIFDRFVRADAARAAARGTGLGLAIVKRIMELHQGRVEVETTLNVGSTFRIVVPLWIEEMSSVGKG